MSIRHFFGFYSYFAGEWKSPEKRRSINARLLARLSLIALLLTCAPSGLAQVDPNLEQGLKPYGSF